MIKGKFILPLGGAGGKTAEFRVSGGWLQWRYAGQSPADTWKNLIAIPSDGKSPEMRYFEGWFQWRYASQSPEDTWKDLVEISFDGDFTINEYGYWRLTVEPTEDELDADIDMEEETMQIFSTEELRLKGHGTVRLIMDSIAKHVTIIGATVEFRMNGNWLEYRYYYPPLEEDLDADIDMGEGWMPIVELVLEFDGDVSAEDGKTPEFRTHEGWVQWRYANQTPEDTWTNLFEVPSGAGIQSFAVAVAAGSPPAVGNGDTLRLRITDTDSATHDIFLGGHAAFIPWHGDQVDYDNISIKDANTIYYINEPDI
jgi:hypothetical protein